MKVLTVEEVLLLWYKLNSEKPLLSVFKTPMPPCSINFEEILKEMGLEFTDVKCHICPLRNGKTCRSANAFSTSDWMNVIESNVSHFRAYKKAEELFT
jgi:hypothetical protein